MVDADRVELAAYLLKGVARLWYDQWKMGREEDAPMLTWAMFEEAFLGCFFPNKRSEAKVRELLNLK